MREISFPLASEGAEGREVGRPSQHRTGRARRSLRGIDEDESLTARERQILDCLAQGLGTAAIAERLSISRTTVRNHSQRILAKLGVHSRLQAVARGYASGLLSVPAPTPEPKSKERK